MTITADFSGGEKTVTTEPLYQWDTGQKLALSGLPATSTDIQVHFANAAMAQAIVKATATENSLPTCDIPNEFLQFGSAAKARAWVFYRTSNTEGYTVRTVLIPVIPRKRPNDYVSPEDPDSKGIVDRAIELLENYQSDLDGKLDDADGSVKTANLAGGAITWAKLAAALQTVINAKEVKSNKKTTLTGNENSNDYYPTTKAVADALSTKAPASTAYTFDSTTTEVPFDVNNPKIIYLNAVVNGENGIVMTSAHNAGFQLFFGRNGTSKIRLRNGADTYAEWQPAAEKIVNKKDAITNSNKTSTDYYPSIKAVADYLTANYLGNGNNTVSWANLATAVQNLINGKESASNKLTSGTGIDEDSTDTEYPTAKAVYDFGADILDEVTDDLGRKENLSNKKSAIAGNETSEQYYPTTKAVVDYVAESLEEVGDLKSAIDDIDDDFYDYVPASLANPTQSGLATANTMWAVRFPSDFVSSPLVTICPKFNANSGTYTATRWYCADDTFPNLSVVTEVESITANINEAVSFENVTKNEFFTFLSSNTADRAYYCNSASKIHNCPSGRVEQSGSSYVYYTGDANTMTTSQFDIQIKQSAIIQEQQQIDGLKIALTPTFIEYERARGSLLVNGTLNTTLNIYYKKYTIPSGETKISLDGTTVHAGDVTGFTPCVLWFVSNGTMMSNQYVSVSRPFQTWDMHEVSIPSGAEEIWAEEAMTIYSGSGYEKDIPRRVALLENSEQTNFTFSGSFTWSKRIFGLRVLADAQGCYFIPFSSLGLGISRMNGRYGDDYIADQIHSTALGAYNTASGIWSYLKNIPCWHTSVPSTTQVFDGSQWNGKKWYAYGTSLTLGAGGGNYVTRVANFSGLIATNKGIGGGALVTNRNIYNALLDMTDGKLEADLITIEVGANDVGPLGEPWSTNTNEFYGALNHCIKSMFASGVQAQIVIMASYPVRYNPSDPTDIYDVDEEYNM